jgi:hypothetical protein
MSEKRIILEMGTGNDLYGQDYPKAARRAVQTHCIIRLSRCFQNWGLIIRRCV